MVFKGTKRITLILSGGTIGTAVEGGFLRSTEAAFEKFKNYGFNKIKEPFKMLSENIGFKEIVLLYEEISKELLNDDTDAVILTHGTDSLTYSAAALSLLLCGINKPVIVVSANLPLEDEKSNGIANMNAAVRFIEKTSFCGVFAAYQNDNEAAKIHFGARLNAARDFDGYVSSAREMICGYFFNDEFVLKNPPKKYKKSDADIKLKEEYEGKVLLLPSYPGLDFTFYSRLQTERGVEIVLNPYHSGTVKSNGKNNVDLLKSAFIPIAKTDEKYESVENITNPHIKFIENITPVSLYFKRILSLELEETIREEYLLTDTCGEYFN